MQSVHDEEQSRVERKEQEANHPCEQPSSDRSSKHPVEELYSQAIEEIEESKEQLNELDQALSYAEAVLIEKQTNEIQSKRKGKQDAKAELFRKLSSTLIDLVEPPLEIGKPESDSMTVQERIEFR